MTTLFYRNFRLLILAILIIIVSGSCQIRSSRNDWIIVFIQI
ncbi:MAG: hypothetical protein AAGJ08_00725 [Cyanobacteria bacterium P01_H01_bin.35]